ncbi:Hypothetical protein A7982_05330 [Minicystis rosea]|nr:Hypothetical protein A7982_05330 [Minicystis rosea]
MPLPRSADVTATLGREHARPRIAATSTEQRTRSEADAPEARA